MSSSLYFWFVAGETSGDARASEVMSALREACPDIRFAGAGGPRMQAMADGPFDSWTAQAAVLGLWDVLKHYGYFRKKFCRMLSDIMRERPDAVVLVDYPGFNLRLAKALRNSGYTGKILYYISPQVWAWNRGRIPKMARILDLMVCVFPFEAPMYEASGLHTVFTGHPLLEALGRERFPEHALKPPPPARHTQFSSGGCAMAQPSRFTPAGRTSSCNGPPRVSSARERPPSKPHFLDFLTA